MARITDGEAIMGPSIRAAGRADLVAADRDSTTHSTAEDSISETGTIDLLSRTALYPRVVAAFFPNIAFRFQRWREDQQTWAALSYLDDRQLKEFGIYPRPPGLTKDRFS